MPYQNINTTISAADVQAVKDSFAAILEKLIQPDASIAWLSSSWCIFRLDVVRSARVNLGVGR